MQGVVIMCGCSGSGKSTWIAGLRQRLGATHTVTVVSMDHYFMHESQYVFDSTKLTAAAASCFKAYLLALASSGPKDIVVVDNTNTTAVEIAPYLLAASAFDMPWCFTALPVPWDDIARNTHGVPLNNVLAQAQRLDQPLPPFWQEHAEFLEFIRLLV